MQCSEQGLKLIAGFEGGKSPDGRYHAYQDSGGVWTIGLGQTKNVHRGMVWTEAQAWADLRNSLATDGYEAAVNTLGLKAPQDQNVYDAWCSIVWNLGSGAVKWDIGRLTKARNFAAAARALQAYNHDIRHVVLGGLVTRRRIEGELLLKPVHIGPRKLFLTSPFMSGDDVAALQTALNVWLKGHKGARIAVDGQFGPGTKQAVARVAFQMGLGRTDAIPIIQRIIENPKLRSKDDIARARARAAATKKNGTGLAGIVAHAVTHIGVAERPAGANGGEPEPAGWIRTFGFQPGVSAARPGPPWCGIFVGAMALAAGLHVTSRVAYCPFIEQDAKAKVNGFDLWVPNSKTAWTKAGPGWLVLYNFSGGTEPTHVGIVEKLDTTGVTALEGNTSGDNPADGGMVDRMHRAPKFVVGFARPKV